MKILNWGFCLCGLLGSAALGGINIAIANNHVTHVKPPVWTRQCVIDNGKTLTCGDYGQDVTSDDPFMLAALKGKRVTVQCSAWARVLNGGLNVACGS